MGKNNIEENKDIVVHDETGKLSIGDSSNDGLQTSSEDITDKQTIGESDNLEIEDIIDTFIVDTSNENKEERLESLKKLSDDLSRREMATESMDINSIKPEITNAKTNLGYADYASNKGLSGDAAIVKESNIISSYFLSDAFKQRAMNSLGYKCLDSMTPEHRKVYDDIVSRGEELATNLRVAFIEPGMRDSIHSFSVTEEGMTSVLINPDDKGFGMSILGHEIAHRIYLPDYINPGVLDDEKKYGIERSPLNTINESNIKNRQARLVYENVFKNMSELIGYDIRKIAKDYVKSDGMRSHDNMGHERAADVHGVRMLMMQEGIWNPFTGEPVTIEQVKTFRKLHPESRIFEYWNNKESVYYLNNIAMSDKVKPDNLRLDYGTDGSYHLVATAGGSIVDKVITERDYDKLMVLDDSKRGVLISRLLDGGKMNFDISEGVSLGELLAKEDPNISESCDVQRADVFLREKPDYLAMSAASFESVSHDLDEGQQQHRGMSV